MIDDTNATLCRNIKYSSELVGGGGIKFTDEILERVFFKRKHTRDVGRE